MKNKKLYNISPPEENADAVRKIYVDTLSDETKRYVDSVTPLVNQQNEYTATNNINMRVNSAKRGLTGQPKRCGYQGVCR